METIQQYALIGQQLAKQALEDYSVLVNDIILSKIKDRNHIEHTLDGILDFCYDSNMLVLFKKLCKYYYFINPESTVFYINSYRDLWDNESFNNQGLME